MSDLKDKAERFAIWRVGKQQDFTATYDEVAKVTGIPTTRVKRICKAKKWRFVDDEPVEEVDFSKFSRDGVDLMHNHV